MNILSQKLSACASLILMFCLTLSIMSCGDCVQTVRGWVLDKDTKQVIDSAYVQNASQNDVHTYTDDKGALELSSISGGLGNCPPMHVAVTKKDYEIKSAEIKSGNCDTIYLERIK